MSQTKSIQPWIDDNTTINIAKNYAGLKSIYAVAVYDHPEEIFEIGFDLEKGTHILNSYEPSITAMGAKKIKAAFACYELESGYKNIQIMSFAQLEQAWKEDENYSENDFFQKYPDLAAINTVRNRACKTILTNHGYKVKYESSTGKVDNEVQKEIAQKANKQVLSMELTDHEEISIQDQFVSEEEDVQPGFGEE